MQSLSFYARMLEGDLFMFELEQVYCLFIMLEKKNFAIIILICGSCSIIDQKSYSAKALYLLSCLVDRNISDWLEQLTPSTNLLDNIRAIESGNSSSDRSFYELHTFLQLDKLAEKSLKGKFDCDLDEIFPLRFMSHIINTSSCRNPYANGRKQKRLNRLVIDLQHQFLTYCFTKYYQQLEKNSKRYDERSRSLLVALANRLARCSDKSSRHNTFTGQGLPETKTIESDILSKLDCVAHMQPDELIKNGLHLSGWAEFLLFVSKINTKPSDSHGAKDGQFTWSVSRQTIESLFGDFVIKPCESIWITDYYQGRVLFKLIEMARENKLELDMLNSETQVRGDYTNFKVAVGLKICKNIQEINHDLFIDTLIKHIGKIKL